METTSPSFAARHEERDAADLVELLELLEGTRERLGTAFAVAPEGVTVVVHGSPAALAAAQPILPLARAVTAPAARRYLAGWAGRDTLHVLAPRLLRARASNVTGSREMLLLTPAALYAQLVVAAANPRLPPPWRPRAAAAMLRWAWLLAGAAQYFSGQTAYARPAIARRLREGPQPAFPPGVRDALLLGGTVVDLLAREEGEPAAVALAARPPHGAPDDVLRDAFGGRTLRDTEGTWRAHLAKVAGQT
jgi:hypothetical protein